MARHSKILILVGVPASGKSSWAREFIAKNDGWIRINRDDFRLMLKNQQICEPRIEKLISELFNNSISSALNSGLNVIIDNTNVQAKYINEFIKLFNHKAEIDFRVFDITVEAAIERDASRPKPVGEKVIRDMHKNYLALFEAINLAPLRKSVKLYQPMPVNPKLPDVVIFDIDGTLAHYQNYRGPFDWMKVDRDDLDEVVANQFRLHMKNGDKIIVLSGRDEVCRELTEMWLDFHGLKYEKLLMRSVNDNRKDSIIKKEIYEGQIKNNYNVKVIYDDRNQVVKMWRSLGLKVFQVEEGDF